MKNKSRIYLVIFSLILFLCLGIFSLYIAFSAEYYGIFKYLIVAILIIAYIILAYMILTRIIFKLKSPNPTKSRFKIKFPDEIICYFEGDKLYTSNHLFPIDIDKIEGVKIISTSKYRSNRAYKVSIKLKGRFFRYTFGIGHISEDKEQKKYDYFLKELKKRHIDYEIK